MRQGDKEYAIVADIGGTFARFSRINLTNLHMDKIEIYRCAHFTSLESVLIYYQKSQYLETITYVAIAIACPVLDDLVCMTNAHWKFSIATLQKKLRLSKLVILNDFAAIAMSLPVLGEHELIKIGQGSAKSHAVKVVLGAGTGLGLAYLMPYLSHYMPCAGEGGHATWGATSEQEWFIHNYLKRRLEHLSYERLLSGQGLENLYEAIAAFQQQKKERISAADIIEHALNQQCAIAQETINQFFTILGSYAGDLALAFGSFGGVYIGGGIVPRLLPLITQSTFRDSFENKGRFNQFNGLIATYIITASQPGMLGAAAYLKQSLQGEMCGV